MLFLNLFSILNRYQTKINPSQISPKVKSRDTLLNISDSQLTLLINIKIYKNLQKTIIT